MTDHANELRRLAQAATHPTTKGRWMRLFGERTVYDRMEDGCRGVPIVAADHHPPGPQEVAYLDFIAAANPAAISELLDRLEAAEKERDVLHDKLALESQENGALRDSVDRACEERDALRAENAALVEDMNLLRNNNVTLRAKIERMERQGPVEWQTRTRPAWNAGTWGPWRKCSEEYAEDIKKTPLLHDWLYEARALYLAPGAQPAPSVPEGWKLVPIEPTPEMIDAAEYVDWGDADVRGSCINAWDRMLAAAPEAKP